MVKFYYDNIKLQKLLLLNAVLLSAVITVGNYTPQYMWFVSVVAVLCLISFSASLYVVVFPQCLAQIDDEGIKIDHNAKLNWNDIESAEQKRVSGCMHRDIIVFKLKDGVKYHKSLMQYISAKSPYGEFSIPLYAMTADDVKAVTTELKKHIKIK